MTIQQLQQFVKSLDQFDKTAVLQVKVNNKYVAAITDVAAVWGNDQAKDEAPIAIQLEITIPAA